MRTRPMHVLFFPKKTRTNRKGKFPIYCRITIDGQRDQFSANVFATPEQWNKGVPADKLIADALNKIERQLTVLYMEKTARGQVTATLMKQWYCGITRKIKFSKLYDLFYATKKNKDADTLKTYKKNYNQFILFTGDISLNKINDDLAQKYLDYLKTKEYAENKHYAHNTICKFIDFMQQIIDFGMKKGFCESNPFKEIQLSYVPAELVYCSEEQIERIANTKVTFKQKQSANAFNLARDMFLVQCYSGVAYADLFHDFSKCRYIYKNFIFAKIEREKSSGISIIPLDKRAVDLLKKYNYKLPPVSNQKYNKMLKKVAQHCNIDIHLTTHVARKTHAMMRLNEGFSMETVSRILGHSTTKVTQSTYARVGETRIVNEIMQLKIQEQFNNQTNNNEKKHNDHIYQRNAGNGNGSIYLGI